MNTMIVWAATIIISVVLVICTYFFEKGCDKLSKNHTKRSIKGFCTLVYFVGSGAVGIATLGLALMVIGNAIFG